MTMIIRDIRIYDATGRAPVELGWLTIEGDRIVEVGEGGPGSIGEGIRVLDGHGLLAMPGLIDCHTHVAGLHRGKVEGQPGPRAAAADTVDLVTGLARVLRSGLATIRDCGYPHHGIFAVRDATETGLIEGPRMVLSGRAICATGGHGASISVEVTGSDEARRAVRLEAKAGANWIKLMMTGGTATPGEAISDVQLTLDEARAAVDEAHRRGRSVCAHCSNLEGTRIALDAGVDSIEHGIAIDDETAQRMADEGVWLAPSLLCTQVEGTAGPESGIPDYVRRKGGEIYLAQQLSFQRALKAGVRIVAATDSQVPYLELGGATLARELSLMTELGMPPAAAILSATAGAAAMLGLDKVTGRLARSLSADILLVEGDPFVDLTALGRPAVVMHRGEVVHQTATEE